MRLDLYHTQGSTCSQKVRLCLAEKGVEWTSHHVQLKKFEHLTPAFLALNPAGLVPLLIADGNRIHESIVINEFLDDAFPEPALRPTDALARARAREWTLHIWSDTAQAVKVPSFHKIVGPALKGSLTEAELASVASRVPNRATAARWTKALTVGFDAAEVAESMQRLSATLDRMEASLLDSRWLAGDAYTLADVDMTPFVHWHTVVGEGEAIATRPRVAAWYAAVKARPSFDTAIGWKP